MSQRARVPPLQPFSRVPPLYPLYPLFIPLPRFASATRYNETWVGISARNTNIGFILLYFFYKKGKMRYKLQVTWRIYTGDDEGVCGGSCCDREWLKYDGEDKRKRGREGETILREGKQTWEERKYRSQLKKIVIKGGWKDRGSVCGRPKAELSTQIFANYRNWNYKRLNVSFWDCKNPQGFIIIEINIWTVNSNKLKQLWLVRHLSKTFPKKGCLWNEIDFSFFLLSFPRNRPELQQDPPPGKLERN